MVYDPCGQLRVRQKALHQKILRPRLDRSPYSYGGIPDKNQLDCAGQHLGQQFVYTGEIRSFYPSIHFDRVRRLFLGLGCSTEVTRALTRLTTSHHQLEQGFITSPIIADRIFRSADERIARLCANYGLIYTRYVDDITISGPFNLEKTVVGFSRSRRGEHSPPRRVSGGFRTGRKCRGSVRGSRQPLEFAGNCSQLGMRFPRYGVTVRLLSATCWEPENAKKRVQCGHFSTE